METYQALQGCSQLSKCKVLEGVYLHEMHHHFGQASSKAVDPSPPSPVVWSPGHLLLYCNINVIAANSYMGIFSPLSCIMHSNNLSLKHHQDKHVT